MLSYLHVSMFACLFLGKGVDAWDSSWVEEHMGELIKLREHMSARDGMEPTPLALLEEFHDPHDGGHK